LDQNLAHDLADLLAGHEVTPAIKMGWDRLENGRLLEAAEQAGFDVMVTADQNLRFQQNLAGRKIALCVLSTNHWPTIQANSGRILAALEVVGSGGYHELKLMRPRLRRRPPPRPDD
jgi:hypothetical protein